jgi:hypothetical protein
LEHKLVLPQILKTAGRQPTTVWFGFATIYSPTKSKDPWKFCHTLRGCTNTLFSITVCWHLQIKIPYKEWAFRLFTWWLCFTCLLSTATNFDASSKTRTICATRCVADNFAFYPLIDGTCAWSSCVSNTELCVFVVPKKLRQPIISNVTLNVPIWRTILIITKKKITQIMSSPLKLSNLFFRVVWNAKAARLIVDLKKWKKLNTTLGLKITKNQKFADNKKCVLSASFSVL